MKRFAIFAALVFGFATFASATAAIQKEAKAKNPKITACKDCHSSMPGTKTNLTDEGKKWLKK